METGRHGRGERQTPTVDSFIQQNEDDCLSIYTGTQDQLREQFSNFLVNKVLNAATVFKYRNWPENEELDTYGDSLRTYTSILKSVWIKMRTYRGRLYNG